METISPDSSIASRIYSFSRYRHLVILRTPSFSPTLRHIEIVGSRPMEILNDLLKREQEKFEKQKKELKAIVFN